MKYTLILLSVLMSFSCNSDQIDEKDLYGYYIYKSGDTLYEEFAFNEDATFQSWLRQKPASTGTWLFKDKTIDIEDAHFGKVQLKIIELNEKAATLLFLENQEQAVFTRLKE
ncbi:MAG: hypothetical protein ACRBBR_03180 [Cellvibrionaceae bacterium]